MKDKEYYRQLTSEIDKLTYNYNQKLINIQHLNQKSSLVAEGLNLIEQMLLRYMYLHKILSMSLLGHFSNLKPAYLSRITERLVKAGYAQKTQCSEDQRVFYISLTEKGYQLTRTHVENYRQYSLQLFSKYLTKEQLASFRSDLLAIIHQQDTLLQKNGIWFDQTPVENCDLYQLLDRRTKAINRFFLHFSAFYKLPYYKENFNHFQNNILVHIYDLGEIGISALSKISGLKLKHLSGALKGLTNRGFLEKFHKENDRRIRYIRLSPNGQALADLQEELSNKFYMEHFNAIFSDKQLDVFLSQYKNLNTLFSLFDKPKNF